MLCIIPGGQKRDILNLNGNLIRKTQAIKQSFKSKSVFIMEHLEQKLSELQNELQKAHQKKEHYES